MLMQDLCQMNKCLLTFSVHTEMKQNDKMRKCEY